MTLLKITWFLLVATSVAATKTVLSCSLTTSSTAAAASEHGREQSPNACIMLRISDTNDGGGCWDGSSCCCCCCCCCCCGEGRLDGCEGRPPAGGGMPGMITIGAACPEAATVAATPTLGIIVQKERTFASLVITLLVYSFSLLRGFCLNTSALRFEERGRPGQIVQLGGEDVTGDGLAWLVQGVLHGILHVNLQNKHFTRCW